MPISQEDMSLSFIGIKPYIVCSVIALLFLYFSTLKVLFDSYDIFFILSDYKQKHKDNKRYLKLFQTRNDLMYHISKYKSEGQYSEAKRLEFELITLDQTIDELEMSADSKY